MNVQTAPDRLQPSLEPLPAQADDPIRATFMPEEQLRRLGEALARGELARVAGPEAFDFPTRVRDNSGKILEVYRAMNDAQARGETVTPAAQWLLDNFYVVEETVFQIKRDVPRRFYRQLPTVTLPNGVTAPRALAIAWLYVAHCDSAVSAQSFEAIVQGFQSVEPLRIGELWALPSLLRFVLIENLRRLALRVGRSREMRRIANELADRVLSAGPDEDRTDILPGFAQHARDTTFATQLLYRLRDGSQNAGNALAWLENELERSGSDAEEIILGEHQTLSSGNVTTGNIIRGLRLINDIDWTVWFEGISRVDTLLREGTDFASLDFPSRDQYRTAIEEMARRSGLSEYEVATRAIQLARQSAPTAEDIASPAADVGFFLVGPRRLELEQVLGYRPTFGKKLLRSFRRTGWTGIVGPVLVMTLLLLTWAGLALASAGIPSWAVGILLVLFAVPASEGALAFFNTIVLQFLKPTSLIGYEFKEGVPSSARTLVVVPSLISSRDDVEESLRNMEVHYLANMKGDLHFALLSDWPDSQEEQSQADMDLLDYAHDCVAELNQRYPENGPRFHLLHRRRLYNEGEKCWMGWERKRGKLHELDLLLRGDSDTTFMPSDTPLPEGIVYVMTMDADTRMTRDAVARLVGKLCHPLNRPVIDPASGRVVSGYAILQPRVTPSLTTGDEASFFQRIFSANRGMDPYVFAVSDLYQDVFGEGTFTGKGLYQVDAMESALQGRIPENAVLSHDLLEGSFARAALVTDVELVEDYPTRYAVDASRQHRWARGDWQLLPFIVDPASGVPGLSRWKMVDNLRRSLTPIFWTLASIAGWTFLPFTLAAQWQALLIVSLFMAPSFEIVNSLIPDGRETTPKAHLSSFLYEFAHGSAQVALRIVLMAHSAWMMGDAIVRTLYRLFVTRQNLLEWRTASQAQKNGANTLGNYYRLMSGSPLIALIGLAVPVIADSTGAFVAFIFAVFWAGAPAFAWFISRSAETEDRLHVSRSDRDVLRGIARRTWLYFETFVTEEQHWLPPDNYQETPYPVVAARTSPTNIGVYLLSIISARDFGWISLANTIERLDQTLSVLERMDRDRGHLYNWYDTKTLHPLYPRYISAVDSGNLAGHLVAVAAACNEWAMAPAAYLQGDFDGMLDTVAILEETLDALPDDRRQIRPLRQRLRDRISGMKRAVGIIRNEPETAAIRTINLAVLSGDIRKLASAIHGETRSKVSEQLALWASKLEMTCEFHVSDAHTDEKGVETLRLRLRDIYDRARLFAFQMDFSFLLRKERKLLSIGYRVDERQLDESCYDLLASEARLTSLFAIAKGDISTEHWFRLGRPVAEIGFRGALISWSGSMFEYLMPPLVMKEPHGGILNQTNNLIIRKQISYGRSKGIPWGISEAAYNARDREMTYQYTNFGVPGLGLKRGLARNTVIAPYATLLASQYMPSQAVDNLERLRAIGALGAYGFHDAVDFTPTRVPEGQNHAVVYNYMAHHQGMSIVAVANVVFEGRMRDRFHSDPVIEAAELLLQEKAPRDIPVTFIGTEAAQQAAAEVKEEYPDTRIILNPAHALRATNLLSNGHYSLMVTATGSGYSRFNDLAVTRWQADPVEDQAGCYLFLTDVDTGTCWSATADPRRAPEEVAQTLFTDDKANFIKAVGKLRTEVECIVISEGNGEGRRISIINDDTADRHLDVTSYGEIVIGSEASDNAHPAFSKMFVETEIGRQNTTIYATRRKYGAGDPDIALAHFVSGSAILSRETEAETDRRAFIGRGRTIADAAAFDRDAKLAGNEGFVLDPIMALRCRVRVPAGKKVSLTFWTVVAPNRAEIDEVIGRLDHPESFQRQAMLAWTRSQVQTRHIGLSLADAANVQKLARYLIYPSPSMRMPAEAIASGLGRQSALWPMAISGDYPIFVLRIGDVADLEIIAATLRMQEYMRARGVLADLVIVNEQAASYVQDLQQAIESLCENSRLRGKELGPRQHIFAVRRDLMDENSYRTLLGVARIVLHTRNGTVFDQIERAETAEIQARPPVHLAAPTAAADEVAEPAPSRPVRNADGNGLTHWNGFGGFDENGRDYVVRLAGDSVTPHPWINIISNANFGFHSSAEGASFTWSRNSRDFQLTPWTNDPVVNRPGEAVYIFDLDDSSVFSPMAAVVRDASALYEARHGQGFSTFSTRHGTLAAELTQVVDANDPVKVSRLTIRNQGSAPARLRVYAYAEWVLGTNRAKCAPTIIPALDEATGALLARNAYSLDFGERTAFLASDAPAQSFTTDRLEFVGVHGTVQAPETVISGSALAGTVEPGRDPCAALARDIEIPAGGEAHLLWLLGDAASAAEASSLVARHRAIPFEHRLAENAKAWDGFLGTLQVETPDEALNAMVNYWLPYQAFACRIRARSAFYQASGAFGFRDQLQDTLALLLHDPSLARTQLLNAAGRQFPEGDVQHWWLPRTGAGVRTTISDDVVWLAYGVHRYIKVTGDEAILEEELDFIKGEPLKEGEHDAFFTPEVLKTKASLYEHCARGLDLAVVRTGANGLPLILGGDWNDGMNRVGAGGRGESVWLGWFLLKALADFAPIARGRKDELRAARWQKHEKALKKALEAAAWDGQWYRRATYDDGSWLGSSSSDECRIDSIAQSWSVLSGHGDPARSRTALEAASKMLIDPELKIAKLFTPPFAHTQRDPGYIKSYPPGVRENGGQYTHAATWLVLALAQSGHSDDAYRLFQMLNPVNHALDEVEAERYRVEPYVVAADIYAGDGKAGRGGWTWYTGSAGWLYRAAVEGILGIRREGDRLHVEPSLPSGWDGFSATLKLGASICRIQVSREAGKSSPAVSIDGKRVKEIVVDGRKGEKHILVTVPA
ncbi:GH36-type glycosyl hydrolase domain-containing protein [Mesorhizobium sp. L-8-3]|uniref:GH36-type glycosyl hydrolase domain-containing protein n=1 Tax=Mesorhizobium sp. L-8-3 TaxID=2744522 RepID=UPI0019264CC6|nr:glucoamylase family protein [Mesorhizobium sp. L-8-3]BCH23976.1 protein ndvB [Mesorhizobium sp. L-8-3]